MARLTAFDAVAARHGFAVVYPQGIDAQWNYVAGIPGYELAADDLGFLPALVEALVTAHDLDRTRVFVVGFSNGGLMAQRLACAARDVIAGLPPVPAARHPGLPQACGPPAPWRRPQVR